LVSPLVCRGVRWIGLLVLMLADLSVYSPDQRERLFDICDFDRTTRDFLTLRFGLDQGKPRTIADVAQSMKLTREALLSIEKDALQAISSVSLKQWNADT
jgi:DNA-directed RNA polymerase sigma subunit (sigma70/sigma32)